MRIISIQGACIFGKTKSRSQSGFECQGAFHQGSNEIERLGWDPKANRLGTVHGSTAGSSFCHGMATVAALNMKESSQTNVFS